MSSDVSDVIASVLRVPHDAITDDLSMDNCASWDSLAHVELMVALEGAFGVTIDEEQIFDLVSVGAIRRFIAQRGEGAVGR